MTRRSDKRVAAPLAEARNRDRDRVAHLNLTVSDSKVEGGVALRGGRGQVDLGPPLDQQFRALLHARRGRNVYGSRALRHKAQQSAALANNNGLLRVMGLGSELGCRGGGEGVGFHDRALSGGSCGQQDNSATQGSKGWGTCSLSPSATGARYGYILSPLL
eukprot:1187545-Prorocentrum_minimum.AAC.3